MIVIPEDKIKQIYEIVGDFTYSSTEYSICLKIKETNKNKLIELYNMLYYHITYKIKLETNYDHIISFSDYCSQKLRELIANRNSKILLEVE